MSTMLQDLRSAVRAFRQSPAPTLVIVTSLAIGIGANTAIFSVVNALLLKPLPYPDPERLVVLWLRSPGINIPQDWPSPGQYIDVRTSNHSFEEMSISQGRSGTLLGLDQPEPVQALLTSSNLFHLLGAQPQYGRLLVSDDDVPGKAPVVILSHPFWARLFNSDPNVIGRSITLNGIGPGGSGPDKNQAIHDVDPTIPVYDVRTMDDRMSQSLARQRFSTIMLGAFAGFALILAAVGVYGVMSHLVTQGTHDIGVCMALGAQPSRLVNTVVQRGMELTGAGLVLGLIGAVLLTRVMDSLLFGVSATDIATFTIVSLVLIAIGLAASYLPARRATLVDPVIALREE